MPRLLPLCVCVLLPFLGSCAAPSPPTTNASSETAGHHFSGLDELLGQVIGDTPVVIAPTRNFQPTEDRERWTVRASASLTLFFAEAPTAPLHIAFSTAPEDLAGLGFWWDGEELPAAPQRHGDGRCEITIDGSLLTAGKHVLTLFRRQAPGAENYQEEILISPFTAQLGELSTLVRPAHFHRYHFIANFLANGVTGTRTPEHLGGALFQGPMEATVAVDGKDGGQLHFRVQNASSRNAVFRLSCGDALVTTELQSRGKATMRLPISPGAQLVRLKTEGETQGLYLWGAPQLTTAGDTRPPIILITLDTTRRDVVPPQPGAAQIMPELARFSETATIYDRAVTTAPWTLPSHASMLSGLYPSRHRAGVTDQVLAPHIITATELLSRSGYFTAGVVGGFFCTSRFGISQGFLSYWDATGPENTARQISNRLIKLIDEHADGPLFLFANYFDVHYPYRAPQSYREAHNAPQLERAFPEGSPWAKILRGNADAFDLISTGQLQASPEALAALRAEYLAEASFVDHELSRVFDALRERGLFDRALIVIVSDHGEFLGEGGYFGHGCRLDPELIHVPMLIKRPRQSREERVATAVSVNDVFPTILAAAGITAPPSDGIALDGRHELELEAERFVYSEEHAMGIHKLVDHMKVANQLFSIETATGRQVVWRDGQQCYVGTPDSWQAQPCPENVATTMAAIDAELEPPPEAPSAGTHDLSAVEEDALRALGYLR